MSENDYKKTYNGFTKFVLWGTVAVISLLVILAITDCIIQKLIQLTLFQTKVILNYSFA